MRLYSNRIRLQYTTQNIKDIIRHAIEDAKILRDNDCDGHIYINLNRIEITIDERNTDELYGYYVRQLDSDDNKCDICRCRISLCECGQY
jgi:hypothetical protein